MNIIDPFTIVIAHKKGGVGKSSNACNIAVELYKKNYPITVIDFDSQKQTTKFNNKRTEPFPIQDIKDKTSLSNFLQNDAGVTLIDLGGYDSDLARATLILADLVIIPLSDSDNELDGLIEFKKIIDEIRGVRAEVKAKLLVTRVHHADTSTHKALSNFVSGADGFSIFNTVIRSRKEYKRMLGTGKSVSELTKGTGAIEINRLIKEIEDIING